MTEHDLRLLSGHRLALVGLANSTLPFQNPHNYGYSGMLDDIVYQSYVASWKPKTYAFSRLTTRMKKVHLIFGAAIVIAFLLTGQYMDKHFHHLVGMPDGPRLLYRTRHIFILFSGLLNLGIGAYFTYRIETWRRAIQLLGSLLIFTASFLFVIAFFYEPNLNNNLRTPLSHYGAYAIAAGAILHVISGAGDKEEG